MELIGFLFLFFMGAVMLKAIVMFEEITRLQDEEAKRRYMNRKRGE